MELFATANRKGPLLVGGPQVVVMGPKNGHAIYDRFHKGRLANDTLLCLDGFVQRQGRNGRGKALHGGQGTGLFGNEGFNFLKMAYGYIYF